MPVNVIVGLQRGDEGKGRFVDMLAEDHDIVARFNGGNNAGHTVVLPDGQVFELHSVPSGIAHPHIMNVIGNGTFVNPEKLVEEIADIESKGIEVSRQNLLISSMAHLIMPHHVCLDEINETGPNRQGSTQTGIPDSAAAKARRENFRIEDIKNKPDQIASFVLESLRELRPKRDIAELQPIDEVAVVANYMDCAKRLVSHAADTQIYLHKQLSKAKPARVLAEGAQAFLLDIEQGMYPFTTSSLTTSGGVSPGTGMPPQLIDHITGIMKAVPSHVGGGPFVTKVEDPDLLDRLHGDKSAIDAEVGTTTGRERDLGYLDLPQIRRAVMVNMVKGKGSIAISKVDCFSRYGKEAPVCVGYNWQGEFHDIAPASAHDLSQCVPVYESLPNTEEDIQDIREYKKLPNETQQLIEFVEDNVGYPITMIGVGPQRDQVILR